MSNKTIDSICVIGLVLFGLNLIALHVYQNDSPRAFKEVASTFFAFEMCIVFVAILLFIGYIILTEGPVKTQAPHFQNTKLPEQKRLDSQTNPPEIKIESPLHAAPEEEILIEASGFELPPEPDEIEIKPRDLLKDALTQITGKEH